MQRKSVTVNLAFAASEDARMDIFDAVALPVAFRMKTNNPAHNWTPDESDMEVV